MYLLNHNKEVQNMKKLLVLCATAMGVLALTGCEYINQLGDLLGGESKYNYDDYRIMLADRSFSTNNTKCHLELDVDGTKSEDEYNYDAESKTWKDGNSSNRPTDIISEVKSCALAAALLEKEIDELFKFYASTSSYRITAKYKDSSSNIELEYKYGADGWVTYRKTKSTDLDSIQSVVKVAKYTYSRAVEASSSAE